MVLTVNSFSMIYLSVKASKQGQLAIALAALLLREHTSVTGAKTTDLRIGENIHSLNIYRLCGNSTNDIITTPAAYAYRLDCFVELKTIYWVYYGQCLLSRTGASYNKCHTLARLPVPDCPCDIRQFP